MKTMGCKKGNKGRQKEANGDKRANTKTQRNEGRIKKKKRYCFKGLRKAFKGVRVLGALRVVRVLRLLRVGRVLGVLMFSKEYS